MGNFEEGEINTFFLTMATFDRTRDTWKLVLQIKIF